MSRCRTVSSVFRVHVVNKYNLVFASVGSSTGDTETPSRTIYHQPPSVLDNQGALDDMVHPETDVDVQGDQDDPFHRSTHGGTDDGEKDDFPGSPIKCGDDQVPVKRP